ncbi:hypothetical protein [Paenibacillus sp. IHBB 3054]|uniref:hypothetical protein n=1 Tax=Paenibacillus sp. IHBB 3054 TaxID=3425689 RepID=UPI003F675ABA
MTNEEAIHAIKCNYPHERYTMLREALDIAMLLLAAESKPMINWIKYDPANPPSAEIGGAEYLISSGHSVEVGIWLDDEWFSNGDMGMGHSEVTHYAHINLPGEDTR